jgi:adenylate kinase
MRVLFTGTTGIKMKETVSDLAMHFYEKNKQKPDLENIHSREHLSIYDVEEEIKRETDFTAYLDSDNYKWQESIWEQAAQRILQQQEKQKPKNSFICMNVPYFRKSRFFPAIPVDLIKRLELDVIVTLIEEAHLIWQRITTRNVKFPTRSNFRLREIFSWRAATILTADCLAKTLSALNPERPPVKNYVVAVKHPRQMLYKLIFEPESLTVYASFPISSTRDDPGKRKQIDDFRMRLHKYFCVFDPATIDERVYQLALKKQEKGTIEIQETDRWPLPKGFSLCKEDKSDYPIRIPVDQLKEVVEEVDNNIRFRDYRMISQSKSLVAFRPNFGKRPSRGVTAEIFYANDVANVRCFIFSPKEDHDKGATPFEGIGIVRDNLDDLFKDLTSYQQQTSSEEK